MNKSEIIRKHLLSIKPSERSPTAVSEALKKKGVNVTVHHVGMVKLALRGKRVMKRTPNKSGRSGRSKLGNWSLFIARDLLKSCDNDLELAMHHIKNIAKLMKN